MERMQFGWLGIPKGDLEAAEALRQLDTKPSALNPKP
jgi:hypothetical protein